MATVPPYPTPRQARRAARAAWRMQRAQMRWQRAYYHRPSIAGPILILAVGVVALLLETGTLEPGRFWPWYATWWPLVLIGLGAILLAEYALDRSMGAVGQRRIGGFISLVVILSLMGMSSHKVIAADNPWGEPFADWLGDSGDWMGMMGDEHSRDVTLRQSIEPNGKLTIEDAHGDVQVMAADDGAPAIVEVSAHQVVHLHPNSDQARAFQSVEPTLTRNGDTVALNVPGSEGASVELRVTVPAGVAVTLHTGHGDVSLGGLRADATVSNAHGDLSADGLGGSLRAQMDHGDATIHDVAGDVSVEGTADDVTISGVKGRTLLDGDFFGDTRVSSVASTVHFHSPRTDLELGKLAGELSMDKGDLHLDNVAGGLKLKAESKDVEINGLAGDAEIDDSNGDVTIDAGLPLGNLRVSDGTGDVQVTLPSNAGFTVEASASDSDDLSSDFALTTETTGGRKTVSGQVGRGGPHLQIMADHGDLSLRRGGVEAAAPPAPAAPPPPPAPPTTGKGRRLHTSGEEPMPTVQ